MPQTSRIADLISHWSGKMISKGFHSLSIGNKTLILSHTMMASETNLLNEIKCNQVKITSTQLMEVGGSVGWVQGRVGQ